MKEVDEMEFDPRDKNTSTMEEIGMSIPDAKEFIRELQPIHLFEGPVPDDNPRYPDPYWVCKKEFRNQDHRWVLYIKLKIDESTRNYPFIFVKGFHIDNVVSK
jgi:hypothetical protein